MSERMISKIQNFMKRIYIMMVLGALMASLVPTNAQTFQNPNAQQNQNQQIIQTGAHYTGTVYEPFSGSVPSEQSAVGASYSPAKIGNLRRGLDTPGDTGQSTESPIGDAVLPLLLMAMVYGGWCIVYRRKRRV